MQRQQVVPVSQRLPPFLPVQRHGFRRNPSFRQHPVSPDEGLPPFIDGFEGLRIFHPVHPVQLSVPADPGASLPQGNYPPGFRIPPGLRRALPPVGNKVKPVHEENGAAVKVHIPGIVVEADVPGLDELPQLLPGHPLRNVRVVPFRNAPFPQGLSALQHASLGIEESVGLPRESRQALRPGLHKLRRAAAGQGPHRVLRHRLPQLRQLRHGVHRLQRFLQPPSRSVGNTVFLQHLPEPFLAQEFSRLRLQISAVVGKALRKDIPGYPQQGLQSLRRHSRTSFPCSCR